MNNQLLQSIVRRQPYPLIFVTISGAHLYGFPSPDSDYDLRGVHVLPPAEVMGLFAPRDTIEESGEETGCELDIVTHDARKFFDLMLKRNGYVLEQLYSPLILSTTPEHEELKRIGRDCITRQHAHHYLGFVATQWRLFEKSHRIKPLLYVYRVLLTGIHLMNTGLVNANLVELNEAFRLPYISDLVRQKTTGAEDDALAAVDITMHEREYARLTRELEESQSSSRLPDASSARPALHDLLLRLRGKASARE